jgi:hypothetical protein
VVIQSIPTVSGANPAAHADDDAIDPLHPRTVDAAVEAEVEARVEHGR